MKLKPMEQILRLLVSSELRNALPKIVARHRIDGPGSSLDLPQFQDAFWQTPALPQRIEDEPSMEWSRDLPRTVGITIDTGTEITAYPYVTRKIAVESKDYNWEVSAESGQVLPVKENWLLKIMDIFGLQGVKFVLKNIQQYTCSSGLGGSASATTGVCILANELAGRPFSPLQLVALASRIEQNFDVSITGTQEQSNVVFGGVTDYIWCPFGLPKSLRDLGDDVGFGTSLRTELIPSREYHTLEQRLCIVHSGKRRSSTDVNAVWLRKLLESSGYAQHLKKPALAYQFRESLRLHRWKDVMEAIDAYRLIRTELCPEYMTGAEEIQIVAEAFGCASFPLGAGGGGAAFIFGPDPDGVRAVKVELVKRSYLEIPVKIKERGHECFNLAEITELWSNTQSGATVEEVFKNAECAV